MALPADRFPERPLLSLAAATRPPARCTVHSCRRCKRGLPSGEPCSLVLGAAHTHVCPTCRTEEEALRHLPGSHSVWGASLASLRRA
jgi:hypothetical protein